MQLAWVKGREKHSINHKTIKFQKEFPPNCKKTEWINECFVIEPINKSRGSGFVARNKKK